MWSNCWIFALQKWIERPEETYIGFRMTRGLPVLHGFFIENIEQLNIEEFIPSNPRRGWRFWINPFVPLYHPGRARAGIGEFKGLGLIRGKQRGFDLLLKPLNHWLYLYRMMGLWIISIIFSVCIITLGFLVFFLRMFFMVGRVRSVKKDL